MAAGAPNILLVMADQMAPAFLPIYGFDLTRAPHMAELARSGVTFESAYCNSPLCSPSRASFMTGRLPSRTRVYDNAAEFSADIPTFAHHLRLRGYKTVLAGKMHFCGPDQLHGFEERLTTDIYPADYGWTPDWDRPHDRPSWYHNMSSVTQAGLCVRTNQLDFDDEVAFAAERALFDFARSNDKRPFLLVASFTHPHDPFAVPQHYWDLYRGEDIPSPSPFPPEALDSHSRRLRHVCAMDAEPATEAQVLNARRAYFGAISYIDDQLGRLMQALQSQRFRRRHNRDPDQRPRRNAGRPRALVQDELLRGRKPRAAGGREPRPLRAAPRRGERIARRSVCRRSSIFPAATRRRSGTRSTAAASRRISRGSQGHDEAIGEYLAEGAIAPLVMIRRGALKFIHSPPDPDQLYDLGKDPGERANLADHPDFADVRAKFRAEVARRWDLAALDAEVRESQRRRRLVDAALNKGQVRAWDFQPFRDATKQYMRSTMDLDDLEASARFPRVFP